MKYPTRNYSYHTRELAKRNYTTFKTWRKFEIKNTHVMLGDLAIHSTLYLGSRHRWLPVSHYRMPGFDLRVLNVKSVVEKVAVGGVFTVVFLCHY
jgi:hypothetical protein